MWQQIYTSSLSADNLCDYGGTEYPIPSSGWDSYAKGIHSKPSNCSTFLTFFFLQQHSPRMYQTCHVLGGDINQIPDMLRCALEEKSSTDVNRAQTMCYWFCFGNPFSHFTAVCRLYEPAMCHMSAVIEKAVFIPKWKVLPVKGDWVWDGF